MLKDLGLLLLERHHVRSSSDSSSSSENEQLKRRNRARAKRMESQTREPIAAPKDRDKLQPKDSVKDGVIVKSN